MKAKELKPGDRFRVDPPDSEWPVRICLKNSGSGVLKWGFPLESGRGDYWCWMGGDVEVHLVQEVK